MTCTEFVYNNSKHSTIGITLFFANQRYHLRAMIIEETTGVLIDEPAATAYVKKMRALFKILKTAIESAQEFTARYYDKI